MISRRIIPLALLLAAIGPAFGGLYESDEPYEFVPRDGKVNAQSVDKFRARLSDLRGIAIDSPQPTEKRTECLKKRDGLSAGRRRLSAAELNVLGAYHYRLHDTEAAMSVWMEASRKDRNSFAAYSNLALVMLVRSDLLKAREYDSAAGQIKPTAIPGMTKEQSAWYFTVDKHLRQVIRKRSLEKPNTQDQMLPDDLFGVQFGTEDGGYQAGQITAAAKKAIPEDGIAIVQQLLLWLPFDARLQWLLAELYNAHGDSQTALALLNDCLERGFHPKLLREHKQILQEHFESLREQAQQQEQQQGEKRRETFWATVFFGGAAASLLVIWQLYLLMRRIGRRTRGTNGQREATADHRLERAD